MNNDAICLSLIHIYFAIRQYVDNYEKYCRELDSAERIEFYEKSHSVFKDVYKRQHLYIVYI